MRQVLLDFYQSSKDIGYKKQGFYSACCPTCRMMNVIPVNHYWRERKKKVCKHFSSVHIAYKIMFFY